MLLARVEGRGRAARAVTSLVAIALAGNGLGCASARLDPVALNAAELERTLIDLRAQNTGYVRQIEELKNQVFILEGQIENRRLADQRRGPAAPSGPTVTRIVAGPIETPDAVSSADPSSAVAEAGSEPEPQSAPQPPLRPKRRAPEPAVSDAGSDVEYSGAAAVRRRHRPVLRISRLARSRWAMIEPPGEERERPVPGQTPPLYRDSLVALQEGRHAVALAGFREFLERHPRHGYADNAQYWIAECYYDLRQYRAAEREFRRVVERYPRGNKVPDAMVKLGLAELALGEQRQGRQELESVRRIYPQSAAADLAAARLAADDGVAGTAFDRVAASAPVSPHARATEGM